VVRLSAAQQLRHELVVPAGTFALELDAALAWSRPWMTSRMALVDAHFLVQRRLLLLAQRRLELRLDRLGQHELVVLHPDQVVGLALDDV
jgi:hypothetical protein